MKSCAIECVSDNENDDDVVDKCLATKLDALSDERMGEDLPNLCSDSDDESTYDISRMQSKCSDPGQRHFLEVFSGNGQLSAAFEQRQWITCGIDIKQNQDLLDTKYFLMVKQLCASGNIGYGVFATLCETYSPARHPKLRTKMYATNKPGLSQKDQVTLAKSNLLTERACDLA